MKVLSVMSASAGHGVSRGTHAAQRPASPTGGRHPSIGMKGERETVSLIPAGKDLRKHPARDKSTQEPRPALNLHQARERRRFGWPDGRPLGSFREPPGDGPTATRGPSVVRFDFHLLGGTPLANLRRRAY